MPAERTPTFFGMGRRRNPVPERGGSTIWSVDRKWANALTIHEALLECPSHKAELKVAGSLSLQLPTLKAWFVCLLLFWPDKDTIHLIDHLVTFFLRKMWRVQTSIFKHILDFVWESYFINTESCLWALAKSFFLNPCLNESERYTAKT